MILPIKINRLGRVNLFSALIVIQLIFVPLTLGAGSHENKDAHKHTNSQPAKHVTGNEHEKQHGTGHEKQHETGSGHEKHPHHTDPVNTTFEHATRNEVLVSVDVHLESVINELDQRSTHGKNSSTHEHIVDDVIKAILGKKLKAAESTYDDLLFGTSAEKKTLLKKLNEHLIDHESPLDATTSVSLEAFVEQIQSKWAHLTTLFPASYELNKSHFHLLSTPSVGANSSHHQDKQISIGELIRLGTNLLCFSDSSHWKQFDQQKKAKAQKQVEWLSQATNFLIPVLESAHPMIDLEIINELSAAAYDEFKKKSYCHNLKNHLDVGLKLVD